MPIVSVQKLENADKDADSLNKFVNGAETEGVKTRLNVEYPTLANAVRQIMETGGFEPFATEAALLASRPTLTKKASYALDTHRIFLWESGAWENTGLSALERANQDATTKANAAQAAAQADATTKANAAQAAAITAAQADATTKANQALSDAKDFSNNNPLFKPVISSGNQDLNNITTIGFYAFSNSAAQTAINSPVTVGFTLEVLPTNTAIIQRITTRDKKTFVRSIVSETPNEWVDVELKTKTEAVYISATNTDTKITQTLESSANTQTKYAYAIADESNNIGFALGINGDIEGAGVTQEPTLIKSEVVWGIADDANNVPLAQLSNGNTIIAGLEHSQSKVNALVDSNGSATLIVDESGALHQAEIVSKEIKSESFIQVHISCYEEDGDIYVVNAGETKKITNDGLNKNPVFVNDRVVFISSKQRGLDKQYQYKDGVISRYYPTKDFAKYQMTMITGQSLSIGPQRLDPISMPLVGAYKLNGYSIVATPNNPSNGSIVPLSEGYYHTIATGFAQNLVDQSITVLGTARTGTAYADLKKGAQYGVFEESIAQVERVSSEDKYSFMPALIVIHGEEDGKQSVSSQTYVGFLREWLDDYNADIRKVKGSSSAVMLTCQTGSIAGYRNVGDRETFQTPLAQLEANNTQPDIFLIGPKYAYTYKDHAHPDAVSTTHLGEMYAKVYKKVVLNGEDWNPLKPTKFTATGSKIIVDFHVPKAPLQFDTEIISSVANQGFELTKSGGVTITDVQITSPTQVTITCSANVPTGCVLSYAWYNGTYQKSGRAEGSRGALKDSDNTPDLNGFMPLNNWCVHFKQTLNF